MRARIGFGAAAVGFAAIVAAILSPGPTQAPPPDRPAAPPAARPNPPAPQAGAGGHFGEPIGEVSPAAAHVHFALGLEQLERGDFYAAAGHLAAARQGLPDQPAVCELLAMTYDQLNMTLDLVDLLPCLESAAPERPGAGVLYERLRREIDVESSFRAAASDHFVASYPESARSSAEIGEILALLEDTRARVAETIGFESSRLVPVVIYEGHQFERATDKPHWATGLFDGKIRLGLDAFEERPEVFEKALAHEYVHALTYELTGTRLPSWFREGLADNLARLDGDGRDALTMPWDASEPPLGIEVVSDDFTDLSQDAARLAYRQSYWMMRHLVGEAGWPAVADVIADLHREAELSFETGFSDVYGETPARYLDRWAAATVR